MNEVVQKNFHRLFKRTHRFRLAWLGFNFPFKNFFQLYPLDCKISQNDNQSRRANPPPPPRPSSAAVPDSVYSRNLSRTSRELRLNSLLTVQSFWRQIRQFPGPSAGRGAAEGAKRGRARSAAANPLIYGAS